jgi:hypothetical protein
MQYNNSGSKIGAGVGHQHGHPRVVVLFPMMTTPPSSAAAGAGAVGAAIHYQQGDPASLAPAFTAEHLGEDTDGDADGGIATHLNRNRKHGTGSCNGYTVFRNTELFRPGFCDAGTAPGSHKHPEDCCKACTTIAMSKSKQGGCHGWSFQPGAGICWLKACSANELTEYKAEGTEGQAVKKTGVVCGAGVAIVGS